MLSTLRQRHLIPSLSGPRLGIAVYFNPCQLGSLRLDQSLGKIGLRDLSTLHIRYLVLGGSSGLPRSCTSLPDSVAHGVFNIPDVSVVDVSDNELEEAEVAEPMPRKRKGM